MDEGKSKHRLLALRVILDQDGNRIGEKGREIIRKKMSELTKDGEKNSPHKPSPFKKKRGLSSFG